HHRSCARPSQRRTKRQTHDKNDNLRGNMKKLLIIIAMAAALMGGCTNKEPASTGTGKKSLTITMIAKSTGNPVFQSARTGADAAAKDLAAKTGVEVKIDWGTPEGEERQVHGTR